VKQTVFISFPSFLVSVPIIARFLVKWKCFLKNNLKIFPKQEKCWFLAKTLVENRLTKNGFRRGRPPSFVKLFGKPPPILSETDLRRSFQTKAYRKRHADFDRFRMAFGVK